MLKTPFDALFNLGENGGSSPLVSTSRDSVHISKEKHRENAKGGGVKSLKQGCSQDDGFVFTAVRYYRICPHAAQTGGQRFIC